VKLRFFFDWFRKATIRFRLWLQDQIVGPYPDTEADRIREQEEAAKVVCFPSEGAAGSRDQPWQQ
jgi:hypothetical protein